MLPNTCPFGVGFRSPFLRHYALHCLHKMFQDMGRHYHNLGHTMLNRQSQIYFYLASHAHHLEML